MGVCSLLAEWKGRRKIRLGGPHTRLTLLHLADVGFSNLSSKVLEPRKGLAYPSRLTQAQCFSTISFYLRDSSTYFIIIDICFNANVFLP